MRILLLGAQEQSKKELRGIITCVGELKSFRRAVLNITNYKKLRSTNKAHNPNIIINVVAYTALDQTEPELAFQMNSKVVGRIAKDCEIYDIRFVHYSTDYVFDRIKKCTKKLIHHTQLLFTVNQN